MGLVLGLGWVVLVERGWIWGNCLWEIGHGVRGINHAFLVNLLSTYSLMSRWDFI